MKLFPLIFSACISFSLLAAQNDSIKVEKEGNVTSFTNAQDVILYAENKSPDYIAKLQAKNYRGLQDEQKINTLLDQQNYIEVLNYLWTEPDIDKRLSWLKQKVKEGHPILMMELGDAYYDKDPTLQTYFLTTVPLLETGARLTYIDSQTTSDKSVSAAPGALLLIYKQRLADKLLDKYTPDQLEEFQTKHADQAREKFVEALKIALGPILKGEKQPSPEWVYAHGLGSFSGEKNTIAPDKYAEIRKKTAEYILAPQQNK